MQPEPDYCNGKQNGSTASFWIKSRAFLTLLAAAALLAFSGCSKAKDISKTVDPGTEPKKEDLGKLQDLVKANKGKGVITGFLTGEGTKPFEGLAKQARNAGGQQRFLNREEIPLTGATILLFDALAPTTAADTTLKTDSVGAYAAVLNEGQYFGFAVYLNLETFELVTASIPNINPIKDSIVRVDTATAIEDVTSPVVTSVFDATSPNNSNVFMVSSIPAKNGRVNIVFSEPMSRESARSIVIGKIDTSNSSSSVVLSDTLKEVQSSWNGDSRQFTLVIPEMEVGVQYGIIISTGLKDLAKNSLQKTTYATFRAVEASELAKVKFEVANSFPAKDGTLKPNQNPSLTFTRPVEIFSILKNAVIEPSVRGTWEVFGPRVVFNHNSRLKVGETYTIKLPAGTKDVLGNDLGSEYTLSFKVRDFEGAVASADGEKLKIALAVENMFDAYLSGDLARFSVNFHANMRMVSSDGIMGRQQFLDMIRQDVAQRQTLAAGFPAPVYDTAGVCKDGHLARWKVVAEGGSADNFIWVEAYVQPGMAPRVWTKDRMLISSGITWDAGRPFLTYEGKKYGFAPDFSRFAGPVNQTNAQHDERFMGEILRSTSTVMLEPVKLELREEFQVDPNIIIEGDTAKVAVKSISHEKFNRVNFRDIHHYCSRGPSLEDTRYDILRFVLVNNGSKWLVLNILPSENEISKADFDRGVQSGDFAFNKVEPINLISPVDGQANAGNSEGGVTFKFKGSAHDSVGGYLVGLAEDGKFTGGRPPYGALLFVKHKGKGAEHSFALDAGAKVAGTNATPILRRAQDLRLPGWERAMFEFVLDKMVNLDSGKAGVYHWKVVAVKDTSASQFLANGFKMDRFYGESDFGATRGYFAVRDFPQGDAFARFDNQVHMPMPGGSMGFGDSDMDGFPDFIELKYGTNPHDRNSYPDFRVDTDGDGMPDFIERLLDPDGSKKLVETKASPEGIKAQIVALRGLKPPIEWIDSDGDGFPDDIEALMGTNPNDPLNNPGTRPRAERPTGVFTGKFRNQSGEMNALNFRAYTDSAKGLLVAYSFILGRDTLKDTVAAGFNDAMGEFSFQVILPKDGPMSGRAYLLRGHYDKVMSIMRGPVDMISAVAKTSTSFGVGPFVGEFASSGRGESVDHMLGGGGGFVPGPAPGPMGPAVYRHPPSGVTENSKLVLGNGTAILIDEFGDTLATSERLEFRLQPDGGYEFHARFENKNEVVITRGDFGGRMSRVDGNWNIDGHFFSETDSAGRLRSIPGQLSMKARDTEMEVLANNTGLKGTMKGWIQRDEFGTGFVGTMPPPPPHCDPARGPCDSTGYIPPPVNSFARPFISGVSQFKKVMIADGIQEGAPFYVAFNGRVFKSVNNEKNVKEMPAPNCGQIGITLEQIALRTDASQMDKDNFERDKQMLASNGSVFIVIQDQFQMDQPARMEKMFDGAGEVRTRVYVVEARPASHYTEIAGMVCGSTPPPPPPCDTTMGPCSPPPCDPNRADCTQPPPPCDPMKGPCDSTQTSGPKLYSGSTDIVMSVLTNKQNKVLVVRHPDDLGMVVVVAASASMNSQVNAVMVNDAATAEAYIVLAVETDASKPKLSADGLLLVVPLAVLPKP